MKSLVFLFVMLALPSWTVRGQPFVAPKLLAETDTVAVMVELNDAEEGCLPDASTIQTRMELALQRENFTVIATEVATSMPIPVVVSFSAIAIYPSICAVSHKITIQHWFHNFGIPTYAVALSRSGIFSRTTPTESKQLVRQQVDDYADLIINEILKARSSQ